MKIDKAIHEYVCQDFDESDNEATLINMNYFLQNRHCLVFAFCDQKLDAGKSYKGHVTGTNPMELRFELAQQAKVKGA